MKMKCLLMFFLVINVTYASSNFDGNTLQYKFAFQYASASLDNTTPNDNWMQNEVSLGKKWIEEGRATYKKGEILAWLGVGLWVAGAFVEGQTLGFLGSLGVGIGIPIMGAGAEKASNGIRKMDPLYPAPKSVWGVYVAGWVFTGIGILMMDAGEGPNLNMLTVGGFMFSVLGEVLHFVAWGTFGKVMNKATHTLRRYSLNPSIYKNRNKEIDGGGLSLSFKF